MFCYITLTLFFIYCRSSAFDYDQEVVMRLLSISAAIGSSEKTRCSIQGTIAKVNDFFNVRHYISRLCAVVMCLCVCHKLMIFTEMAPC